MEVAPLLPDVVQGRLLWARRCLRVDLVEGAAGVEQVKALLDSGASGYDGGLKRFLAVGQNEGELVAWAKLGSVV